jgi:hypothetical protein
MFYHPSSAPWIHALDNASLRLLQHDSLSWNVPWQHPTYI